MSASREKNKRKEQAAVPETANEAKKGMSKGLKTTLIAVCTVLVVCIVVFFYMLTSGFFASHTTAATVSGHNLSCFCTVKRIRALPARTPWQRRRPRAACN